MAQNTLRAVEDDAPVMFTTDDYIDELVESIASYAALSKRMRRDISPRWRMRIHENLYAQLRTIERLEQEISCKCTALDAQRSNLSFYERFFSDSEDRVAAAQYHRRLKRINAAITGGYHLLENF